MYRYLNIQLKRTKLRNYHQLLLYFVIIIYVNIELIKFIIKQTFNDNVFLNIIILTAIKTEKFLNNLHFCYRYFNSQTLIKL